MSSGRCEDEFCLVDGRDRESDSFCEGHGGLMFRGLFKFAAIAAGAMAAMVWQAPDARANQEWLQDFFSGGRGGSSGSSSSSYSGGGFFSNAGGKHSVSFPRKYSAGQIIVSFGDRRLYYTVSKGKAISYPIAIPKGDARWSGTLRISAKKVNPGWTPTASMRRENPKLPAHVPGGHPRNPLGVRALYLGSTLYRIHGTDAPWLIGRQVSKGCIRMHNSHVIDLYNRARIGTRVTVTWSRFASS